MRRVAFVLGVVFAASIGAVLAGCSDDGDGSGDAATTTAAGGATTTAGDAAPGQTSITISGVPFTFSVPDDFVSVPPDQLPQGFKLIIGLDQINFLDVRLASAEELAEDELADEFRPGIEASSTRIVEEGTVRRGDVTFTRFVVEADSGGTPTQSHLHFFVAGGVTWEVACQSNEAGRARMDAACELMLDTLTINS